MMPGVNDCRVAPGPLQSPRFDSPNDAAIPQVLASFEAPRQSRRFYACPAALL